MKVTIRNNGKFCRRLEQRLHIDRCCCTMHPDVRISGITIKVFGKRIAIHRDACGFCPTQPTPLDFYDK